MKILLYCHHSIGIGHLTRTLQIANAMRDLGAVEMICGGLIPAPILARTKVRLHQLHTVDFLPHAEAVTRGRPIADEMIMQKRLKQIRKIIFEFQPDVVLVEMFPFGRKNLSNEILSLIADVRENPGVRVLCSVRDVLITTRPNQAAFDRTAATRLNKFFDAILIHSDPDLIRLDATFSTFSAITIPVIYTGYIAAAVPAIPSQRISRVVVSAGGGRVGRRLLKIAADAAPVLKRRLGLNTTVIAGPLASAKETLPCESQCLEYLPFVADLAGLLAQSTLSISQCGYNTATDILQARIPAVFVPFETSSENEQCVRAQKLSSVGRSIMVHEASLTTATLIAAAQKALKLSETDNVSLSSIRLDGIRCTCLTVKEQFSRATV